MKPLDEYIYNLEGQQREIIMHLDLILRNQYQLEATIKWGIPFYLRNHYFCYLNPIKKDGVELVFYNGSKLSNEQGILHAKGRKMVSGVELYNAVDIPEQAIQEIIEEALILDDMSKKRINRSR